MHRTVSDWYIRYPGDTNRGHDFWPRGIYPHNDFLETPDQLRKRADELEASNERKKHDENKEMIEKLRKQGYTIT